MIANRINDFPDDFDPNAYDFFGGQAFLTRDIITPLNALVNVINGQVQLLNHAGINDRGDGTKYVDILIKTREIGRLYGGDWMFIPWSGGSGEDIEYTASDTTETTLEYCVFYE